MIVSITIDNDLDNIVRKAVVYSLVSKGFEVKDSEHIILVNLYK